MTFGVSNKRARYRGSVLNVRGFCKRPHSPIRITIAPGTSPFSRCASNREKSQSHEVWNFSARESVIITSKEGDPCHGHWSSASASTGTPAAAVKPQQLCCDRPPRPGADCPDRGPCHLGGAALPFERRPRPSGESRWGKERGFHQNARGLARGQKGCK